MKATGLDILSPFYRFLADALFRSEFKASNIFIASQKLSGDVLIVGCGDGQIMSYLNTSFIQQLDLLDISEGMLRQAKKNNHFDSTKMRCIQSDYGTYSFQKKYDVIIMPFFLDMLSAKAQKKQLQKTMSGLNQEGLLIISDLTKTNSRAHTLKIFLSRVFFSLLTLRVIPPVDSVRRSIESVFPDAQRIERSRGRIYMWEIKLQPTRNK